MEDMCARIVTDFETLVCDTKRYVRVFEIEKEVRIESSDLLVRFSSEQHEATTRVRDVHGIVIPDIAHLEVIHPMLQQNPERLGNEATPEQDEQRRVPLAEVLKFPVW
jgi:hypothetical protein